MRNSDMVILVGGFIGILIFKYGGNIYAFNCCNLCRRNYLHCLLFKEETEREKKKEERIKAMFNKKSNVDNDYIEKETKKLYDIFRSSCRNMSDAEMLKSARIIAKGNEAVIRTEKAGTLPNNSIRTYTKDDYLKDLYISEHGRHWEATKAKVRIRDYEHGRQPDYRDL